MDDDEVRRLYELWREGTGECTKVDGYAGGGGCVGEEDKGDGTGGCHACDPSQGAGESCDGVGRGELRAETDELEDEVQLLEVLELDGERGS